MQPTTPDDRRELARRVNDGLEIALYWSADDDTTSLELRVPTADATVRFTVARDCALDAFYHPFAHLPRT